MIFIGYHSTDGKVSGLTKPKPLNRQYYGYIRFIMSDILKTDGDIVKNMGMSALWSKYGKLGLGSIFLSGGPFNSDRYGGSLDGEWKTFKYGNSLYKVYALSESDILSVVKDRNEIGSHIVTTNSPLLFREISMKPGIVGNWLSDSRKLATALKQIEMSNRIDEKRYAKIEKVIRDAETIPTISWIANMAGKIGGDSLVVVGKYIFLKILEKLKID